jgi:AbrB family looped-hinge helix DNA binding protein
MLVTVGPRGQITIPKALRQTLNIHPGDRLVLIQVGDEIKLRPVKKSIFDLQGTLSLDEPIDFDTMREKVKEHVTKKVMESLDDSRDRIR